MVGGKFVGVVAEEVVADVFGVAAVWIVVGDYRHELWVLVVNSEVIGVFVMLNDFELEKATDEVLGGELSGDEVAKGIAD